MTTVVISGILLTFRGMPVNLPETDLPRIVIAGAGFAGLTLARKLARSAFQVVLLDRNNFHQFQPLFYQVAMAGLEPSGISFPLRKMFRKNNHVHIRMAEIQSVDLANKRIMTDAGQVNYDMLVLAMGVRTNYYGNTQLEQHVFSLKSVSDALYLRNAILTDFEKALMERDFHARQGLIDIVIVGGGPTGVELAGSLAEMRRYILPQEYGEFDAGEVDIHLVEGAPQLLPGMSPGASQSAERFLKGLGVMVRTGILVTGYDGETVTLSDGSSLYSRKVIWAAGVKAMPVQGIPAECTGPGGRLRVDQHSQLSGYADVFVLGDLAFMEEGSYRGHPQVAQPAMQQARHLASNIKRRARGQSMRPFRYKDLGTLATVGRNKAVADLPVLRFQGFWAWVLWLVVHLKSILGVKNKLFVLLNWIWGYLTYDQSLRIIIRPKVRKDSIVEK